MSIHRLSCSWVLGRARWASCLAVFLVTATSGSANVNQSGMTLNLSAADLWSGTAQTNPESGRLVLSGTPVLGIVSTNPADAKVIVEPLMVINASGIPVAGFSATPLMGSAPLEVQFFDLSSGGLYEILSWTWDFGDGSPYSSDRDPVHTYDIPGTYTVSLTILTTGGLAHAARTQYITVMHTVPAAHWTTLLLLAMIVVFTGMVLMYKKCMGY